MTAKGEGAMGGAVVFLLIAVAMAALVLSIGGG